MYLVYTLYVSPSKPEESIKVSVVIRILASRFLRPRVTAIFASFLDRRRISSRVRLLRLSVYLNNLFDRKLDLRWTEREREREREGAPTHPPKMLDGRLSNFRLCLC